MKKFRVLSIVFLAALIMAFTGFLVACKPDDESDVPPPADEDTLQLSSNTLNLEIHEDALLTVTTTLEGEVVWSTSESGIATVDGGKVVAVSAGSAVITAAIGEVSDTCTVNVTDQGLVPTLSFADMTEDRISLLNGSSFEIKPTLSYNGKTYSDVTYSYDYDTDIFEMEENVLVTKKMGEATLTVTASWRGFNSPTLVREIAVRIDPNASVTIGSDESTIELYTKQLTDEETEYIIAVSVYEDDQEVQAPNIQLVTDLEVGDNEDAVELDANKVTAKQAGTIHVKAIYTSAQYGELESNILTFVVKNPIKNIETTEGIIVDASSPVLAFDGLEEGATKVLSIKDNTNNKEIGVTDGNINGADLTKYGEAEWDVLYDDEVIYRVPVLVVTKVIKTGSDFASMYALGGYDAENGAPDYPYSGYFILGNNIDASSTTVAIKGYWKGEYAENFPSYGFQGTFDGRGYTVDGLTIGDDGMQGVFGTLGKNAVVKNVAFTNLKTVSPFRPMLASNVYGGTVENVFVSSAGSQKFYAPFMHVQNGSTIKNLVVWAENGFDEKSFSVMMGPAGGTQFTVNVGDGLIFTGDTSKGLASGHFTQSPEWQAIEQRMLLFSATDYASDPKFTALTLTDIFDCTDSGVWKIDVRGIPVFKTAREELVTIKLPRADFDLDEASSYTVQSSMLGKITQADITSVTIGDYTVAAGAYTLSGGTLSINNNAIKGTIPYGDYTLTVVTAAANYKAELSIVTKIIKNINEWYALKSYGGNTQTTKAASVAETKYEGYFILGDDIDLLTVDTINGNNLFVGTDFQWSASEAGFHGIFDGRGHVIKNGIYNAEGLFGYVSANATLKNFAIVNAKIAPGAYLLAKGAGMARIENVYIEATTWLLDYGPVNTFRVFEVSNAQLFNVIYRIDVSGNTGMEGGLSAFASTCQGGSYFANAFAFTNHIKDGDKMVGHYDYKSSEFTVNDLSAFSTTVTSEFLTSNEFSSLWHVESDGLHFGNNLIVQY